MTKKQKNLLIRVLASLAMMIALVLLPLEQVPVLRFVLFLVPYLTAGHDILRKAWKGIRNRQVFDENFLMAVATVGAMALGEYTEGVAVMVFYQIGELFQSYAVGKSRRNITELMDIRPDYANLEEDGEVQRVDPDDVEVGSIIVIQPGEKVPIDGVVVEGTSTMNTSALTGESVPRTVREGEEVLSGSINQDGLLRVRTTKEFDESTASKILELVENASSRKSKSEQFITKFARVYTPAVCYSALALAILGPLGSMLLGGVPSSMALWGDWIYRALTFLVISCPCAIVVSIPLSFFGGLGGASSRGILIKGSNFMETLSKVDTVVFDKTGSITRGNFEVVGVHHNRREEQELLELAALAEMHSTHPIAASLRRAHEALAEGGSASHTGDGSLCEAENMRAGGLPEGDLTQRTVPCVSEVREVSGKGVIATIDGKEVAVGNSRLMEELGIEAAPCHSTGTIVHVAVDGTYEGHIVIADEIKPGAQEALTALRSAGVQKLVMLTGDLRATAEAVAKEVGITDVRAELLPGDKVAEVEKLLQEQKSGRALAFVGDGINDAPVLARADLGIAMGALGSDAAIEAADVVLMDDDPRGIARAVRIARKCIRIVYENIVFAIGVKLVCLLLGALGIANMWLAIFADVGVMVLCVLNAIRALWVRNL